jgi:hypothetical protein
MFTNFQVVLTLGKVSMADSSRKDMTEIQKHQCSLPREQELHVLPERDIRIESYEDGGRLLSLLLYHDAEVQ